MPPSVRPQETTRMQLRPAGNPVRPVRPPGTLRAAQDALGHGPGWGQVRVASLHALWAQPAGPTHSQHLSSSSNEHFPLLTLVRSFLAFSNLSISIFWALATKTREAVSKAALNSSHSSGRWTLAQHSLRPLCLVPCTKAATRPAGLQTQRPWVWGLCGSRPGWGPRPLRPS